ncbi:hypothetical protein [Streptomyces antibioticus]|uniref:hypothetical protein n=1 Tax=Streptomyces antibioticus TaxID=1890 RepID=UPI0022589D2A|nr:hypothetical protein [Streptomyces antibioticus]MCX4741414.1 hypothetical protein [Streptomyces antibioticus]
MSAAAPTTGVDLLTGAGLDEALAGAETVVNLTNSPTFDDTAGMFAVVKGDVLTAPEDARIAATRYRDWLAA